MGWVSMMGVCFGCGNIFMFNPTKVPSIKNPKTGEKEPVCGTCMERANRRRETMGLPPHFVHPEAYEACDEYELGHD